MLGCLYIEYILACAFLNMERFSIHESREVKKMKQKILLLGHDFEIKNLVKRAFSDPTIVVDVAESVKEAADRVHHQSFDLILMNSTLPGEDSIELCSSLQLKQKYR